MYARFHRNRRSERGSEELRSSGLQVQVPPKAQGCLPSAYPGRDKNMSPPPNPSTFSLCGTPNNELLVCISFSAAVSLRHCPPEQKKKHASTHVPKQTTNVFDCRTLTITCAAHRARQTDSGKSTQPETLCAHTLRTLSSLVASTPSTAWSFPASPLCAWPRLSAKSRPTPHCRTARSRSLMQVSSSSPWTERETQLVFIFC